jgi:capsular exopolysaccharide synthesis family protein
MITRTPDDASPKAAPRVDLSGQLAAEYYQALWARLFATAGAEPPQALGVTSCTRGEGVSTIAMNLAVAAAAQPNHRVLLVEANLQHPVLARWLNAESRPGLADLLSLGCDARHAVHRTHIPELFLLPAGAPETVANADLASLPSLLSDLKVSFDSIVFDLPPAESTSLALPLAGLLDGVVLVIEAERVPLETARRARDLLAQSRAVLSGVVLNKRREHLPRWLGGKP